MDDLNSLAPFLEALCQVVQDASSFHEDDKGLDLHFKKVVQREVARRQSHSLGNIQESRVLNFPIDSALRRSKIASAEEFISGNPAIPIRQFQICSTLVDEILQGWHGRMRAINCLPEKARMIQVIAEVASRQDTSLSLSDDVVRHAASILGRAYDEISERHTLLPFFDALEGLKLNRPGTKSGRHRQAYDRRAPLRLEGERPRFCAQCASEDVENKKQGISYWRRTHQLPGVLWCAKHGSQLNRAPSRAAFAICPHQVTDWSTDERVSTLTSAQMAALKRYVHLAMEILDQSPAIDSVAASVALGEWAKARGLRISKPGKRPTVSSYILEVMPIWWLTETFPRVQWSTNRFIWTVDGACSPGATRYTSSTLCLLAAVLCDNPDEALKILWPRRASKPKLLGSDYWASKSVFDVYVSQGGHISRVAEELELPLSSVGFGLLKQGLPGLGKTPSATIKAIQAFLNGDGSLADISAAYGVPTYEMEEVIRSGCMRFKTALDAISKRPNSVVIRPTQYRNNPSQGSAA